MSKKFVIHLTEKYSNPIVQVNSMVLHSPDQQNYTFYAPNTTESYTLKVTCEGYQDYIQNNIINAGSTNLYNVILQPCDKKLTLGSIIAIAGAAVPVTVATLCLVCSYINYEANLTDPNKNPFGDYSNETGYNYFADELGWARDMDDSYYKSSFKKKKWYDPIIEFFSWI